MMEIAKSIYLILSGILGISALIEIVMVHLFDAPEIFTGNEISAGIIFFIIISFIFLKYSGEEYA